MTLKEFKDVVCEGRGLVIIECCVDSTEFRGKTYSKAGPLKQMQVQPWLAYPLCGADHDFKNNPHWVLKTGKLITSDEADALNKFRKGEFRKDHGVEEPEPIVTESITHRKKSK